MMDEKTYKKEIVRMWDSIRDDEYKGMDVCSGVYCNKKCALYGVNEISKPICCDVVDAFQQIKAIEKWSKEHPKYDYLKGLLE